MMLSEAKVLVVGAGGLGCPASLALALGGVRRLTFIDDDRVEESNLHRQLWHRTSDLGRLKAESAADRLNAAFPEVKATARVLRLDPKNGPELFKAHDLVVDGTDGIETKFLLSDLAVLTGVPLIYGGVLRFDGQAMVIAKPGPCLRCLFEVPPPADAVPTCAQAGVLGSVAGVIGALQAQLALALLTGAHPAGDPALLHTFDGETLRSRTVKVRRSPECASCGPAGRPDLLILHATGEDARCQLP